MNTNVPLRRGLLLLPAQWQSELMSDDKASQSEALMQRNTMPRIMTERRRSLKTSVISAQIEAFDTRDSELCRRAAPRDSFKKHLSPELKWAFIFCD